MLNRISTFFMNEDGAGMTEYILLVVLVAVAAVVAVTTFGGEVKNRFMDAIEVLRNAGS